MAAALALDEVVAVVACDEVGERVAAAGQDAAMVGPTSLDPGGVALLLATSGTTGRPKAAALTSAGLLGQASLLAMLPVGWQRGPRGGRDVVLAPLPLAHVMGFSVLVNSLLAGVHVLASSPSSCSTPSSRSGRTSS